MVSREGESRFGYSISGSGSNVRLLHPMWCGEGAQRVGALAAQTAINGFANLSPEPAAEGISG